MMLFTSLPIECQWYGGGYSGGYGGGYGGPYGGGYNRWQWNSVDSGYHPRYAYGHGDTSYG